jgi:FHS family L-fucose permease-like MFS transporter
LIMMIMGGGIISWLQGVVADSINIHYSYIVGVLCFAPRILCLESKRNS